MVVQPAFAARVALTGPWAWTRVRRPRSFAAPQAASSCSCESVGPPPSRLLSEAKILMASAPASARRCTSAAISSGPPVPALSEPSDVMIRGPGTMPRFTASRTGPSTAAPRLCTVVKPASSIRMPFSRAWSAFNSGGSSRVYRPSAPKCQCRWTWVSMNPGRIVPPGKSSRRLSGGSSATGRTAAIRSSRTTTPWPSSTPPRPSSTRSAVRTSMASCVGSGC